MNRTFAAGTALTLLGLMGYGIGLAEPYPGRAFSVTGVMIGLTLAAVGSDFGRGDGE
ncbi:hypothetical protein [Haloarchaeobius amylolyticus]|uniref:hypothetical protein n=1 Tax=Haloarchaeobius amylolyticus TaxID=1198296 RepID=UPI0022717C39|nr:hypothetical protein [Haloarchaeobius amylolyticus]